MIEQMVWTHKFAATMCLIFLKMIRILIVTNRIYNNGFDCIHFPGTGILKTLNDLKCRNMLK